MRPTVPCLLPAVLASAATGFAHAQCQPRWSSPAPVTNGTVWSLGTWDDGAGPALYVGGFFTAAGEVTARKIARWNGSTWSALGTGLNDGYVWALGAFDDGGGPALYVGGGGFTTAGGVPAMNIARWDGSFWSALGSGTDNSVFDLAAFDEGNGSALYAAGAFTTAGGVQASKVARWDGVAWSALGSGMNESVHALAVFDDGTGPALYAGGGFTIAGGRPVSSLARWAGGTWSAVEGLRGFVRDLGVSSLGGAPELYAAGYITAPAGHIARWDGESWSALGAGLNDEVFEIAFGTLESGPSLYAGGWFTTAGGTPANAVARWDGRSWSALGAGLIANGSPARAIDVFDEDGTGPRPPSLMAGGWFHDPGGPSPFGLARWGCPSCYPDCDSSTGVGILDIFDFLCFQNRYSINAPYACDCDTSTGPGVCDIFDFLCFQNKFAEGCP